MADSKRYQTNPDDRVEEQTAISDLAFRPEPTNCPTGAGGTVFDLGAAAYGFAVILNGGTATYQPCASDGTVVAGSSSAAVVSGALVQRPWRWVKIVATTQPATFCLV